MRNQDQKMELKKLLADVKRTRLIRAGADLIIPDYSQIVSVLSLLKVK